MRWLAGAALAVAGCAQAAPVPTVTTPEPSDVAFYRVPAVGYHGECHEAHWDSYEIWAGDCDRGECLIIGKGHCDPPPRCDDAMVCQIGGAVHAMRGQRGEWFCMGPRPGCHW